MRSKASDGLVEALFFENYSSLEIRQLLCREIVPILIFRDNLAFNLSFLTPTIIVDADPEEHPEE